MPVFSTSLLLLAAFVVFFGGVVKGTAGFGYAIASTALLASFLPPSTAVVLMILPMLVANLFLLREFQWHEFTTCLSRFWPYVVMAMAGTVLGMVLLNTIPTSLLTGGLGVFTLLYVVAKQPGPEFPANGLSPGTASRRERSQNRRSDSFRVRIWPLERRCPSRRLPRQSLTGPVDVRRRARHDSRRHLRITSGEWRPFAPSILEEAVDEYLIDGEPAPFMISAFDVEPEKREEMQAVLHSADDTTRPQTVSEHQNPRYHRLISEFADRTGVPVVLNTSFNDHAEPIVNTPTEALKDFFGMGLDMLALQDVLVRKADAVTEKDRTSIKNI